MNRQCEKANVSTGQRTDLAGLQVRVPIHITLLLISV